MEIRFTSRELEVMSVLWDGPATVAEVQARIPDELAYTTVLSVLRVLEEKGFVGHDPEGRAYRYRALIEREKAGSSALRRMKRLLFGGSPHLLFTQLIEDEDLTDEELRRMKDLLARRLGDDRP